MAEVESNLGLKKVRDAWLKLFDENENEYRVIMGVNEHKRLSMTSPPK